jgi:hypothetical protein
LPASPAVGIEPDDAAPVGFGKPAQLSRPRVVEAGFFVVAIAALSVSFVVGQQVASRH